MRKSNFSSLLMTWENYISPELSVGSHFIGTVGFTELKPLQTLIMSDRMNHHAANRPSCYQLDSVYSGVCSLHCFLNLPVDCVFVERWLRFWGDLIVEEVGTLFILLELEPGCCYHGDFAWLTVNHLWWKWSVKVHPLTHWCCFVRRTPR